MDLVSGLVVYLLLWWWVFLMSLPLAFAQRNNQKRVTRPSAPRQPYLWRKIAATTVIAGILCALVNLVITSRLDQPRCAFRLTPGCFRHKKARHTVLPFLCWTIYARGQFFVPWTGYVRFLSPKLGFLAPNTKTLRRKWSVSTKNI